jgi:hypothetical protein
MAGDRIRVSCDYGNERVLTTNAQLVDGVLVLPYSIVNFNVTTVNSPNDLTITAAQLDTPYQVSALISGGSAGNTYFLQYSITLNDPDQTTIVRTGPLQVF